MSKPANAAARNTKVMNRFDLTSRLVAKLKNEEAVVGGIGNTNFDLWATGQRPQNFYMLGSMGLAFPIALGDIPTSGAASASFTISIVGCNPNAQFTIKVPWSSAVYDTGTFTTTMNFRR